MGKRACTVLLCAVLTGCALASAFTAGASASPAWRFPGSPLLGSETIVGKAAESRLEFPGLTTKCELSYAMTIFNNAGIGKGEITELQLKNCTTNGTACAVESASAKTPWPLHLATVEEKNYVILEKVRFDLAYSGEECALSETPITITGTAGGLLDNTNSTITFNALNFAKTGTELKLSKTSVEWICVLTTEATGVHKGQALEVG